MLKIRLTRVGKKNSPAYRVVVAEQKKAVQRKFIEILGNYNPIMKPKQLVIDKERALFWIGRGAQPSDTVNNLMVDLGILAKDKKINKVYGKKTKKKDEGKESEAETAPVAETPKADEPVVEETKTEEVAPEVSKEEPKVETPTEESEAVAEPETETVENTVEE